MNTLTIGQRICTYFDGSARYGRVERIEAAAVICTFEDDQHAVEYAMLPGEVYAVALPPKDIDQLIADQGARPIADIGTLAGAIPDEDLDAFFAEIYANRNRQAKE